MSSKPSAGAQGVIFNLPDGGGIRRFAQQAKRNQIYIAYIWDSPPWFTPFDANEYWTVYAAGGVLCKQGCNSEATHLDHREVRGGKIAGVTSHDGNTLDVERGAARDAAIAEFPKIEFVGSLPGLPGREPSLKAAVALLERDDFGLNRLGFPNRAYSDSPC